MEVSFGRFGVDTVLFIKPANALELSKIATTLGIQLSALEPKQVRAGKFGKAPGYKHDVVSSKECFYCREQYPVKINKIRIWRSCCKKTECKRKYANDRYLYRQGKHDILERQVLARNIEQQSGIRVRLRR